MRIINHASVRVAVLPPLSPMLLVILWLVFNLNSSAVMAHDPGLSIVDIELRNDKLSAHITYAKKDIEQFIRLDKDHKEGVSVAEFDQAKTELEQFVSKAVEFSVAENIMRAEVTDIELDKSDAVHFRLEFLPVTGAEIIVHSRMIDQFALGHRQFVKVRTAQGLVNSRILSARNPRFQANLPRSDLLERFNNYVIEGIWHIWIGFDHILFVITLLLPAVLVLKQQKWYPRADFKHVFKQTVKVISAFTIAHSLTLALTEFNIITLPVQAVESIIAASVVVAACNNIFIWINHRLWLLAFVFGLIHGMGFATVLNEIGLHSNNQVLALIGFNLGVELGQLAIIAAILPALFVLRKQHFYKPVLMQSGSWAIVVIASVWFFERITETTITQYFI